MGRRRETDEQIDRGGMMTEKKNVGEQHLSYKDALDFYWSVQLTEMQPGLVFMPPGIIKLSLLTIIHSTEKYIIIQES